VEYKSRKLIPERMLLGQLNQRGTTHVYLSLVSTASEQVERLYGFYNGRVRRYGLDSSVQTWRVLVNIFMHFRLIFLVR